LLEPAADPAAIAKAGDRDRINHEQNTRILFIISWAPFPQGAALFY
jgi:hypothetical protein